MAITIKGKPNTLTSAFNEVWYYVDSTNKGLAGFRYVFDFYQKDGVTYKARFLQPPRPNDGYGEINLDEVLQSLLSYDFNFGDTAGEHAPNSSYEYELKIGESYLAQFEFTGWTQVTTGIFTGKVKLTGVSTHTLIVGDQIEVDQADGGASIPALQGLFTVIEKTSNTVTIDLNYYLISGEIPIGGKIYYSDKRKVVVSNIEGLKGLAVFNGAIDKVDFNNTNFNLFKMNSTGTSKKFLTSCPNNFPVRTDSIMFFNLASLRGTTANKLRFQNDAGESFDLPLNPDSTKAIIQAPVTNLENTDVVAIGGATLPVVKDDTKFYTVKVLNASNAIVSELKTFYINQNCDKKKIQLCFIDSMGSVGSFHFEKQAVLNYEGQKETANFSEGSLVGEQFKYDIENGGKQTIRSERQTGWSLTTDWLTNDQLIYFNELLDSPKVFLIITNDFGQDKREVEVMPQVTKTNHPTKRRLQNRTIEVRFSLQREVNI